MEAGNTGTGRRMKVIWAGSLVATALISLLATAYFQRSWSGDATSLSAKKKELLAEMRLNLARSVENEKSAVMALSDEQSRSFAEESRSSSADVDGNLKRLERLIAQGGSDKERELVKKFSESWNEAHAIDAGLLESAMQNTNIKAAELSNTISAELLRKIDENLAKMSAKTTQPARRPQMEKMSAEVAIALRNISIFQNRHINAASDTDKQAIDLSMQAEILRAGATLKNLERLGGEKSRAYVKEAVADFGEFIKVNEEIGRLSHLNTNRTTLELSLGKKRLAEAECDRALKSLQAISATAERSAPR
ncbi:MAG: hypothetical protein HGB00_02585 [Chlorobiaceae bacterium]|nr:hypothetical protein [Chlorobiaceae bacterium]